MYGTNRCPTAATYIRICCAGSSIEHIYITNNGLIKITLCRDMLEKAKKKKKKKKTKKKTKKKNK